MALHVHRSNRMEALADALAERLHGGLPETGLARAFATVPVVVGSRGMASWLGHQLASRRGVLARVDFPFPRQALDGALAAALGERPAQRWWQRSEIDDPWQPDAMAWRCVQAMRARSDASQHPDFSAAISYLRGAGDGWPIGPVSARELTFARDVADVLDRVGRKRPDVALRWLRGDRAALELDEARSDAWLAELMAELGQAVVQRAPARALERLSERAATGQLEPLAPHLHVFGLSTQGGPDLAMLSLLGTCAEVHLYVLAPSQIWLGDAGRGHGEDNSGCPLLAGLGGPSRDLQLLLEALPSGYQDSETSSVFQAPEGGRALALLQRSLLDDLPLPPSAERAPLSEDDTSITLHACPGALRQVEELRDELLRLFADPERHMEPRDVVVMTPDIQTYAPLIAAAFAHRPAGQVAGRDGEPTEGALPAIPVHIADLGLRAVNPVAEVMLRVLELPGERLSVAVVLDLLALGPIQARFELDDDDVADLQRMLLDAGARWGLDAADRADAGQPRLHQNTLAFASERIALGALYGEVLDDGGATVLTSDGSADALADDRSLDFVPWAALDNAGQLRFGKLHALLAALRHHRHMVAQETDGAGWRVRLDALRADLCATSDAAAWLEARVEDELAGFFGGLQAAGFEGDIGLDALRTWLQGRFEVPRSGERTITGAVTVCALEPMRSVPFEVVVLLGMDDASFPRVSRVRAWDPMGRQRRRGEHDRRAADRHLLLEALISARQRLMITWTASDERSGEPLPPSVPIAELMEALDGRLQATASGGAPRRARQVLTRLVPLQPWSGACFDGQRARSFNQAMLAAARRVRAITAGEQAPDLAGIQYGEPGPPGRPGAAPGAVDFGSLGRAVLQPAKVLLTSRHEVRLGERQTELPDREVFDLDPLEAWQIRDPVVRGVFAGGEADHLEAEIARRWRAEGRLPVGPSGRQQVAHLSQQAAAIAAEALGLVDTSQHTVRTLRAQVRVVDAAGQAVNVGGSYGRLSPQADDPSRLIAVDATASKHTDDRLLRPWIALLTALADPDSEDPVAVASLARADGARPAKTTWLQAPASAALARAHLGAIVGAWRRAHQEPVPLFEGASLALVATLREHSGGVSWWAADEAARRAARYAFERSFPAEDPWIEAVWGDVEPDQRLPLRPPADGDGPEPPWVAEAAALFGPLLEGMAP